MGLERAFLLALPACSSPEPPTPTEPVEETDPGTTASTPPSEGPARYPFGARHSPITPWVVDQLAAIGTAGDPLVFMKVGDSITVDSGALYCFADDPVDLPDPALEATLDHFRAGDAAGTTPFDRDTLAGEIGQSAGWAIAGDPSPIDEEIAEISPRFAVIQFGTNDLELGTTFESALWGFGESLLAVVDAVIAAGVIPVLLTIPPRGDDAAADAWVPTYDAVIHGIAQGRQVPLADLNGALLDIDGWGLAGDGVHLDSAPEGPCALVGSSIGYGNNTRNLLILEALDRAVSGQTDALDPPQAPLTGSGRAADPVGIDGLPFTDLSDTSSSGSSAIDVYEGCGADQDESGPEVVYRLELNTAARVRALVVDAAGVDIDVHLLGDEATGASCLARDDHLVELDLEPGTYHIVLDTFVADGVEQAGSFVAVVSIE